MNSTENSCKICPAKFYDDGISCRACPPQCNTCVLVDNEPFCDDSCDLNIAQLTNGSNCSISPLNFTTELNNLDFNESAASGWTSSEIDGTPVTKCGLYNLVGGNLVGRAGSVLRKTFTNLLAHNTVYVRYVLFLIDQQPSAQYAYTTSVDDQSFNQSVTLTLGNSGYNFTNECG